MKIYYENTLHHPRSPPMKGDLMDLDNVNHGLPPLLVMIQKSHPTALQHHNHRINYILFDQLHSFRPIQVWAKQADKCEPTKHSKSNTNPWLKRLWMYYPLWCTDTSKRALPCPCCVPALSMQHPYIITYPYYRTHMSQQTGKLGQTRIQCNDRTDSERPYSKNKINSLTSMVNTQSNTNCNKINNEAKLLQNQILSLSPL